jgi:predicted dienelactone hydrolase
MPKLPRLARALRFAVLALASAPLLFLASRAGADAEACLRASARAGARCLERFAGPIEKCRRRADAGCEAALRSPGGELEQVLAAGEAPLLTKCDDAAASALGFTSAADVVLRDRDSCGDFGEDHVALAFADDPAALAPDVLTCQKVVAKQLAGLRKKTVSAFADGCYLRAFAGRSCNREARDAKVERRLRRARAAILGRCGAAFDALGLGAGATPDERLEDLLATVVSRGRHYAQRVVPPNPLGPAADFGPYPVGVKTLQLEDPARPDLGAPAEARPMTVEVYYPSTEAAVAGLPLDVVSILGIDVAETPAFRDAGLAAGSFPLVLFSHGNGGIRFQSFFFAAHLASHGFVVATPDHHGNTFLDSLLEIEDPEAATNRPLDMSFLIDAMGELAGEAGGFFEGAVDLDKVGMSGHSFGGYTSLALAGGSFDLGSFHEPRIKAILPQAPAAGFFEDAFFATIAVPTLVVGGSLDETTPFEEDQQRPFDRLPAGAAVVGLANLVDAGHFTLSDFCEVDRELLAFLGGFEEACEPRHLPWRHAHDIVNFLSLQFFDATLNGNAAALAELDPARLAGIEDLVYQAK